MRKLKITYQMEKAPETAESYIELPISEGNYQALMANRRSTRKGYSHQQAVQDMVQDVLCKLTLLQGYERCTNYTLKVYIGDHLNV